MIEWETVAAATVLLPAVGLVLGAGWFLYWLGRRDEARKLSAEVERLREALAEAIERISGGTFREDIERLKQNNEGLYLAFMSTQAERDAAIADKARAEARLERMEEALAGHHKFPAGGRLGLCNEPSCAALEESDE